MIILFHESQTVFWKNKSGTRDRKQFIPAGTVFHLRAKRKGHGWELKNGNWFLHVTDEQVEVDDE